jgi:hypothetical protein
MDAYRDDLRQSSVDIRDLGISAGECNVDIDGYREKRRPDNIDMGAYRDRGRNRECE